MPSLARIDAAAMPPAPAETRPRPAPGGAHASRQGFLLVEILVAFVVAALALGGFMLIFSTGLHGLGAADASRRATLWAESKIEAIGVSEPLADGGGRLEDGSSWNARVAPYPDEMSGGAGGDALPPVRLFTVVVTVSWSSGGQPQSVSLATLRLARRGAR